MAGLLFFPVNWSYGQYLRCWVRGGRMVETVTHNARLRKCRKCGAVFWRHRLPC